MKNSTLNMIKNLKTIMGDETLLMRISLFPIFFFRFCEYETKLKMSLQEGAMDI